MRNDTKLDILWDDVQELKASGGGGGGSDLPDVTAADNGKILGVVNGAWNKTDPPSGAIDYSTTEQLTGLKWIDGSPIYQKTFVMENSRGSFTEYAVGAVAPEISGTVLSMNFSCKRYIDGSFYGYITGNATNRGEYSTANFITFQFRESDTSILYRCDGYGLQIKEMYLTVLYTKATATRTKKKTTKNKED